MFPQALITSLKIPLTLNSRDVTPVKVETEKCSTFFNRTLGDFLLL